MKKTLTTLLLIIGLQAFSQTYNPNPFLYDWTRGAKFSGNVLFPSLASGTDTIFLVLNEATGVVDSIGIDDARALFSVGSSELPFKLRETGDTLLQFGVRYSSGGAQIRALTGASIIDIQGLLFETYGAPGEGGVLIFGGSNATWRFMAEEKLQSATDTTPNLSALVMGFDNIRLRGGYTAKQNNLKMDSSGAVLEIPHLVGTSRYSDWIGLGYSDMVLDKSSIFDTLVKYPNPLRVSPDTIVMYRMVNNVVDANGTTLLAEEALVSDGSQMNARNINKVQHGTTANRPSSPATGQLYFDTTISPARVIIFNGTAWVNVDGTAL